MVSASDESLGRHEPTTRLAWRRPRKATTTRPIQIRSTPAKKPTKEWGEASSPPDKRPLAHTRCTHHTTQHTRASRSPRVARPPRTPCLPQDATARTQPWHNVSPTRPRRTRPRKAPSPNRTHAATFSTSHPYPKPFSPWLGFSLAIYPWLGRSGPPARLSGATRARPTPIGGSCTAQPPSRAHQQASVVKVPSTPTGPYSPPQPAPRTPGSHARQKAKNHTPPHTSPTWAAARVKMGLKT